MRAVNSARASSDGEAVVVLEADGAADVDTFAEVGTVAEADVVLLAPAAV